MSVVLLAALSSFLLLRGLIPFLRRRLLDLPNSRSSHRQPTPRGGGLSFVVVASVSSLVALVAGQDSAAALSPLIAFPLAVVGLLDDRHDLPSLWRYFAQLLTAVMVLACSPSVRGFIPSITAGCWLLLPVIALLIFAVTAVINFTNFMDGLDGLVAGCMAVSLTAAAIMLSAPWPIWSLVGALLGFLLWNWSPAKVFMGDVGSIFLGAVFAALVLQASTWPEALALLLLATPLMADACLCVLRRLISGDSVFVAHRLHLFQRLHQVGWPHSRVSSLYIVATALLAIALFFGGLPWLVALAAFELLIGFWLDQRVAIPFDVASCNRNL